MPVFKSPENIADRDLTLPSVFLAGSIEMDKAEDWQSTCENQLAKKWNVFNPRRESWDNSWKQEITNPQFNQQVNWELNALEEADLVIMNFLGNTKSPISLLEFGLYARSAKMKVVCEPNFWRKGNVDIVCAKYGIEQFTTLEELIKTLNINQ